METPEEVKTKFNKNLNHLKSSDLELTQEQKNKLNGEFVRFIQVNKNELENFIAKKRTYIEDNKHHAMTQYIEKLIEENDKNI